MCIRLNRFLALVAEVCDCSLICLPWAQGLHTSDITAFFMNSSVTIDNNLVIFCTFKCVKQWCKSFMSCKVSVKADEILVARAYYCFSYWTVCRTKRFFIAFIISSSLCYDMSYDMYDIDYDISSDYARMLDWDARLYWD